MALVPLQPQGFARLPCWHFWWQEIKMYKSRIFLNVMIFVLSLMKIHQLIRKDTTGQRGLIRSLRLCCLPLKLRTIVWN